jgi:outer membrane protein OmpA-like peptidoglycan-associated protein
MMDRSLIAPNTEKDVESTQTPDERASMEELRELILGEEKRKIQDIEEHLGDISLRAREVGDILPEAILIRTAKDDRIAEALSPTIADILRTSIKKDSKALGDALFPVMGPAIRKAITSTLWGMIQSLNQLLEHSVSFQGLKWRLEAIRTRKSFAEIVLMHTLVYRVEQVLLILTDSGLLLQHVVAREISMEDPDLVSGMLTAIQDFVRDSFGASQEDTLETLRMGDRFVLVEEHRGLTLAVVIRGNPPVDFNLRMQRILETVHLKTAEAIDAFDGDTAPFEAVVQDLEDCLETKLQEEKKRPSPFLWAVPVILTVLLGFWIYRETDTRQRWRHVMATLHAQPGLVVTGMERQDGRVRIYGFKDPLATPPALTAEETGVDTSTIRYDLQPFYSLDPPLVLKRLARQVPPPETVTLGLEDHRIVIRGASLPPWLNRIRSTLTATAAGIEIDSTRLVDLADVLRPPPGVKLSIEGRKLVAAGNAPHHWIIAARRIASTLPEISGYEDQGVTDTDRVELFRLKGEIESVILYFRPNTARLSDPQRAVLLDLGRRLSALLTRAGAIQKPVRITVVGEADASGSEAINLKISNARAEAVRNFLNGQGLDAGKIGAIGLGAARMASTGGPEKADTTTRRVRFSVAFTHALPSPDGK